MRDQRTRCRSIAATLTLFAVLAVACGSGDPEPVAEPVAQETEDDLSAPPLEVPENCPKPTSELEIENHGASWAAENGKPVPVFERCLAAPADQAFTITLTNRKVKGVTSLEHNVAIYPDSLGTEEVIMRGEYVKPGKSLTYEVEPLTAGEYLFRCDLHVQNMKGVLVVE